MTEEQDRRNKHIEAGIKAIAEKFDIINKYIEDGKPIPNEYTKNFVTFPLSDDPYKDIE